MGKREREYMEERKYKAQFLEIMYEKYDGNIAEIGRQLGISRQRIHQLFNRIGMKSKSCNRSDEALINAYEEGKGYCNNIKKILGVKQLPYHRYNELGLKIKSTRNEPKWITAELVLPLYKKYKGNRTRISKELGCHNTSLGRIFHELGLKGTY